MSSFYGNGIAGAAGQISKTLLKKIKEVVKFFDGDVQDIDIIFSGGDSEDEIEHDNVTYDGGDATPDKP